jgi:hypothetical protein
MTFNAELGSVIMIVFTSSKGFVKENLLVSGCGNKKSR